ncbi:hypothetical protein SAMN02745181_3833 [Rubritalea squalenifaciens DSM 18772]|uniref:Uncharacterized protein n=1 Tax=Rubritalea squalenifaciens DSM 18772 TaxID=1123071 RepID=A0A1M6SI61_9BACT|nr:hypothetical protein [Rubritalea squalenifaciens]SHK44421.1 hypothetical protein SAMN02745181_3833 [Rubritalea squalenifaciens DSM 18772]
MTGHLKTASLFIGLLLICSCESKKKEEGKASAEAAAQEKVAACPYSEVWIMRGWQGHMGVVIALKEETKRFDYWFYSDVGNREKYPASGSYTKTDTSLLLKPSSDSHFYSTEWTFTELDGMKMLASNKDLENKRDNGRWLRSVDLEKFWQYLGDNSFMLQLAPELEK